MGSQKDPGDLLMVWRNAFDLASFRGAYMYHSNHEQFRRAISHTIKSISTGKVFDTEGTEIDRVEGVYHGPWQIKNAAIRNVVLDVRNRLQKIIRLSYKAPDFPAIDNERNTIIRELKKYGKTLESRR